MASPTYASRRNWGWCSTSENKHRAAASAHLKIVDVAAARRPIQATRSGGEREGHRRRLTLRDDLRRGRQGAVRGERDRNLLDIAAAGSVVFAEVRGVGRGKYWPVPKLVCVAAMRC